MHELSIALSMLDIVQEESERRGHAQVLAVHLKLGALSGVVKEALLSAFELAREQTEFTQCALIIQEVPVVLYCPQCHGERAARSAQQLCCVDCGAASGQIVQGRELQISAMEIRS